MKQRDQGIEPLPGSLLVPTELMPDPEDMRHVIADGCSWLGVEHDDVLLVVSVVANGRWPRQLTALHMRTQRLLQTNDVTFWWLQEV